MNSIKNKCLYISFLPQTRVAVKIQRIVFNSMTTKKSIANYKKCLRQAATKDLNLNKISMHASILSYLDQS